MTLQTAVGSSVYKDSPDKNTGIPLGSSSGPEVELISLLIYYTSGICHSSTIKTGSQQFILQGEWEDMEEELVLTSTCVFTVSVVSQGSFTE